jgi:hypothetical protein
MKLTLCSKFSRSFVSTARVRAPLLLDVRGAGVTVVCQRMRPFTSGVRQMKRKFDATSIRATSQIQIPKLQEMCIQSLRSLGYTHKEALTLTEVRAKLGRGGKFVLNTFFLYHCLLAATRMSVAAMDAHRSCGVLRCENARQLHMVAILDLRYKKFK